MCRLSASFAPALAVAVTVALGARPGVAAVAPAMSFDQMAQAWMGAVTLLADDGGDHEHGEGRHREHGDHEHGNREHARGDHDHGDHDHGDHDHGDHDHGERAHREKPHGEHGRGEHAGGGRGPGARGPAPRVVAGPGIAKLDEILARLARIEAKLDGRAGGPPRIEMRGPWPPAGRPGPRAEGRPEIPEEVREQARKRMEEGRERMDQARQAFRQMEDRIKKLEAEIERLKADR